MLKTKENNSLKDRSILRIIEELKKPHQKTSLPEFVENPIGYLEKKLSIKLTPDQIKMTNALMEHKKVMVTSCHSCIEQNELITLADGSIHKAVDLVGKHFEILTLDENENIVVADAEAYWNASSPVYEIVTESGRRIRRTGFHPLWKAEIIKRKSRKTLVNVKGWTFIEELKVGDYIAATEVFPVFGSTEIDKNILTFISAMIGDGHTKGSGQFIQVTENAILKEFRESVQTLGCSLISYDNKHWTINGLREENIEEGRITGKIIGHNYCKDLMIKYGIYDKLSVEKEIPKEFFTLTKPLLRHFLSRLFATDGWYYANKPKKGSPTGQIEVGFCSLSENLIRQISALCLRFGINGNVRYKEKVNAWIFEVRKGTEVLKFVERIGILGKEDKEEIIRQQGLLISQSKRSVVFRNNQAPKNTRWESIKSIEIIKYEKTVNIEVEKYHTFLTNVFERNSGKCCASNSPIFLSNGSIEKAGSLVGKNFKLITSTPNGLKEVNAFADNNKYEDIYETTTESGRKIETNHKHPLYKFNHGWEKIDSLKHGDLVAVSGSFPYFGDNELSEEEIIVPYLITDSYVQNEVVHVLNKNPYHINKINVVLKSYGEELVPEESEWKYKTTDNSILLEFMEDFNISPQIIDRSLSNDIFTLNKENVIKFLSAIFKDSIFVVSYGAEQKIKYKHRSEQLIRDLSFLLLKLGITSRVYKKENKDFWSLSILNVVRFKEVFNHLLPEISRIEHVNKKQEWRTLNSPPGTYWERIVSIIKKDKDNTVAISVPEYESYLGNFFEHNSFLAGGLLCWNYDVFPDSVSMTTGPNEETIKDGVWKEVRNHRETFPLPVDKSKGELYEKSLIMHDNQNHYAKGVVSSTGGGIAGKKSPHLFVVFDEAVDISDHYWDSTKALMVGEESMWLALMNPTDPTCRAHYEWESDTFKYKISISALNNPNVIAGLINKYGDFKERIPIPYGNDLNLQFVEGYMTIKELTEIEEKNRKSFDIEWPPKFVEYNGVVYDLPNGESKIYRPKSDGQFEPRILGKWPSNTDISLWSEAVWEACKERQPEEKTAIIEMGCDPSYKGSDACAIVIRRGKTYLEHRHYYDLDSRDIAEMLKALAQEMVDKYDSGCDARSIPIRIDCTGSDGVYSQRDDFNFIKVISNSVAMQPKKYKNRRSELWCEAAELAEEMVMSKENKIMPLIDVSRMTNEAETMIKKQLLAVRFYRRAGNIKEVEKKEDTKRRIKESPDDADAFNLAFSSQTGDMETRTRTHISGAAVKKMNEAFGYRRTS